MTSPVDRGISGKDGKLLAVANTETPGTPAEIADITKWTYDEEVARSKYASSSTGGWKRTVAGQKEWSGTLEGVCQSGQKAPFASGDYVDAKLQGPTTGDAITGTICIGTVKFETDIEEGKELRYTCDYDGDGAPTKTGIFAKPTVEP